MKMMFPDPDSSDKLPELAVYNPSGHSLPFRSELIPKLLHFIESGENAAFSSLEIVFVDEDEIVRINTEYLERDYVTDIISFRYDEDESNSAIEGTLYCCAPRIEEQSREHKTKSEEEFLRVVAHGLLHLTGYNDQTEPDKKKMTELEDKYLKAVMSRA